MTDAGEPDERLAVERTVPADATTIFDIVRDPQGHVAVNSSGMLMDASGEPATAVGDTFVVHMDREALNDFPLGLYDVIVTITKFEQDRLIEWSVSGENFPPIGHVYGYTLEPAENGGTLVTSHYDWSGIDDRWRSSGMFPVIPESALRATLGILHRTVVRASR